MPRKFVAWLLGNTASILGPDFPSVECGQKFVTLEPNNFSFMNK